MIKRALWDNKRTFLQFSLGITKPDLTTIIQRYFLGSGIPLSSILTDIAIIEITSSNVGFSTGTFTDIISIPKESVE